MNKQQKHLLEKLLQMPVGTVLQKGSRKRILVSVGPGFIFYKTPSKPKSTNMQNIKLFLKWAENAEIVS